MTATYYVIKSKNSFTLELRQERFREQYEQGREHPHDVCAIARSIEEMRSMTDKHITGEINWSAVESTTN